MGLGGQPLAARLLSQGICERGMRVSQTLGKVYSFFTRQYQRSADIEFAKSRRLDRHVCV